VGGVCVYVCVCVCVCVLCNMPSICDMGVYGYLCDVYVICLCVSVCEACYMCLCRYNVCVCVCVCVCERCVSVYCMFMCVPICVFMCVCWGVDDSRGQMSIRKRHWMCKHVNLSSILEAIQKFWKERTDSTKLSSDPHT